MSTKQVYLTPVKREKVVRDVMVSLDARWFLKAAGEFGFEAATGLNLAVTRSMGKTEIRRLMSETGSEVEGIEQLKTLFESAAGLYFPEEHKVEFAVIDENTLVARFRDCYVFQMTSRAGTKDIHRCAFKPRAQGWLEG